VIKYLPLEMGETTCASEPGKFCRFAGVAGMCGKHTICLLFGDDPSPLKKHGFTNLYVVDGWTRRCKACLDMFPTEVTQ
jgi:hypothetical protein